MRNAAELLPVVVLSALLLAGCATRPSYVGPGPSAASATVRTGAVVETSSVASSGLSVVAVDGKPTGIIGTVKVAPGEHRIRIRYFNGYALIHGNITRRELTLLAEAGHAYEIRGSYCCGYILGRLDLWAIDRTTERQVAERRAPAAQ